MVGTFAVDAVWSIANVMGDGTLLILRRAVKDLAAYYHLVYDYPHIIRQSGDETGVHLDHAALLGRQS